MVSVDASHQEKESYHEDQIRTVRSMFKYIDFLCPDYGHSRRRFLRLPAGQRRQPRHAGQTLRVAGGRTRCRPRPQGQSPSRRRSYRLAARWRLPANEKLRAHRRRQRHPRIPDRLSRRRKTNRPPPRRPRAERPGPRCRSRRPLAPRRKGPRQGPLRRSQGPRRHRLGPASLPRIWPPHHEGQYEKIASIPTDRARDDDHGGKIGDLKYGFFYAGDRPKQWKSLDDIWVHGYWAWDWANSYEKVESIDRESRLIKTISPYGLYGFRPGQRFYFLNIIEELDQPGEYFVDRATGLLYFWPPADPASGETLVSLIESPLVTLKDASNITLRGLIFEAARGNALTIDGGAKNTIAGCNFRQLGNYALQINGGLGHQVVSCDITYTGDGGVSVSGGDRQTLTPAAHAVLNCRFHHQGRWSKCYVPAVLASGVGIRIANNLIHDHPHCAILYSGNDHIIEFNEIHHVALETGDVGAIYSGRDWSFRGNVIRNNFIHETGGVGMGSMGVYMDDCVSGTEIVGNIFYRVTRAAFLGGGRDHRVINNVFVECSPAVALDGRGMDTSPVWHNMVADYMKKQLANVPSELYRTRYPALKDLDKYYASDSRFPPENNVVARNVCVGGQWLSVGWNSAEPILQLKDNYMGKMDDFVAPDKLDFRLKPECPALKSGFEPIPTEKIGLQPDAYRSSDRSLMP
jgi:hypothetical protein